MSSHQFSIHSVTSARLAVKRFSDFASMDLDLVSSVEVCDSEYNYHKGSQTAAVVTFWDPGAAERLERAAAAFNAIMSEDDARATPRIAAE